jgi:hypothetical protein
LIHSYIHAWHCSGEGGGGETAGMKGCGCCKKHTIVAQARQVHHPHQQRVRELQIRSNLQQIEIPCTSVYVHCRCVYAHCLPTNRVRLISWLVVCSFSCWCYDNTDARAFRLTASSKTCRRDMQVLRCNPYSRILFSRSCVFFSRLNSILVVSFFPPETETY